MSDIGEVIGSLKGATDALDNAAILAKRAEADAREAAEWLAAVASGSEHPLLLQAIAQAREAAAKAGRLGRLYSDAARAYVAYLNHISPGSGPASGATPAGEVLPQAQDAQAVRHDLFGRLIMSKGDDVKDAGAVLAPPSRRTFTIDRRAEHVPSVTPPKPVRDGGPHFANAPPDPGTTNAGGELLVLASLAWIVGQGFSRRLRGALRRLGAAHGEQ